jgi:diguanylate cyclase (GGDEF)-like protein/PAS domain S-box-containing protein
MKPTAPSTPVAPEQARIQSILDTSLDAVIQMDAGGRISGWNQQAERCFGWLRHEVIGLALHDVIIPPRYREAHVKGFAHFLKTGQAKVLNSRIEIEGLHRQGHEFPIELAISAISTSNGVEFSAFIRDITERRRVEDELRIASTAFQTFEGMVITDARMVILKVNDAFAKITGYSREDAVGKKSSIFRENRQDSAIFQNLIERLPIDRFWRGEVWDRRRSGESYPVWLNVTAVVDAHDVVTHYVIAFVDNSEHKAAQDRIHHLAFYDPLTQLPNRVLMLDRLQQILLSSERKQEFGAILLIDLDDFKNLNETLGHALGDLLLKQVALRLKECLHTDDTIARVGGDEFVVVLQGLDCETQAAASRAEIVAERIRDVFQQAFDLHGHKHHTSPSIGICLFVGQEVKPDQLLKHAENAMYRAKQSGRNCIRFFDSSTQAALEARFSLITLMREGLPAQFSLYYQIQIDSSGTRFGAEALIRWQHPERGMISPAMFIPLAEETGFILPLGAWVLTQACQQLVLWANDPAMRNLTLSVNVSAKQFQQEDFTPQVLAVLAKTGANPARLKLELTEGLMLYGIDAVIEKMLTLKRLGVSFSIDDFGTGYSSLAYLKRLPLDQLKIDQSFVRDVLEDPNDAAIVRAVITLGQSLGLAVIAEGVETSEQRHFLEINGCKQFQGYLFGRPLPVAQFEALVRSDPLK